MAARRSCIRINQIRPDGAASTSSTKLAPNVTDLPVSEPFVLPLLEGEGSQAAFESLSVLTQRVERMVEQAINCGSGHPCVEQYYFL